MMLDPKDSEILAYLRKNGRESYRHAAQALKIHPSTVISRTERMQKEGIITSFGANLDLQKLGYEFMALVDIYAASGHIAEVGQKLRNHAGVVSLWDVTGEVDMVAFVACKSRQEFNKTIKHLSALPHVERTVTHVILNVIKSESEFGP